MRSVILGENIFVERTGINLKKRICNDFDVILKQMASAFRDNAITRALSRISLSFYHLLTVKKSNAYNTPKRKQTIIVNKTKRRRIYLLTWNVNGKAPPDDMNNLLQLGHPPLPDIYAIGLQEVSGYDWESAFTYVLHNNNFVRIKSRKLQGIHTFLFVHRLWLPYVSNVESELTRTGFGGYWGNKGASTVRLDFKGVNIVVVNCHLAAHREEVMARIEDVDTIIESQKFKDVDSDNILDHDYVFWIGDMNFRLDDISRDQVLQLIQNRDYQALLEHDQLSMVREERLIFDKFQEGAISFPPSYKFDNGTDVYDTSEKKRVPAYTDRILYLYHNTDYGPLKLNADVMSYRSHPIYKSSDHRPVSAIIAFSVPAKCIHGPVTFQLEDPRIYKEIEHKFRYKIRKDFETAADDWIGLYKANFPHFDSYLKYQWVSQAKYLTSKDRNASVTFSASQISRLDDDTYVLCYMTRKGSLCGISPEFEVSSEFKCCL
ncbi:inositol polyphosphate 5-phosphatase K [Elysia marginata]|uniref:Inositol polyphosphate 5-phosphatase K n=1 Tax=Elysia marginata TaxID=1093978 RepID=A0AAV4FHV1_9GAST|nr:inositol polyphosphate 5-phosphatase K [Elysia marginata]